MTRRPSWLAVVIIPVLVGCGVPSDTSPRAVPPENVPFGLLDRDETVPPSTSPPASATLMVYLVSGARLAGVRREAPAPAMPDTALRALLLGPTSEEAARGFRTAIATASGVSSSGIENGLVRVELGPSFDRTGSSDHILAVAQIVYTVTELAGVEGASFTLSGRAVEVPRSDGTLTAGPVRRQDFATVAPV